MLHPTSLPGAHAGGALGDEARAFLRFMRAAGLRVWQTLPLGPVHADRSPYGALSLDAGGEHLLCLRRLRAEPWLRAGGGSARSGARARFLTLAAQRFGRHADAPVRGAYQAFIERERDWLDPYCAFRVLRRRFGDAPWQAWPREWRDGAVNAAARLAPLAADALARERLLQFLFDRQWRALRADAAAHGIALFGDVAFYPALDSVDVWRHRHLFRLDAQGWPLATAGVPPDAFAPGGQAWGAAVYDWARMAVDGFAWWRARLRVQGARFDLLRLDHFRGFEAYWSIPAGAAPGEGSWQPGPGAALLSALHAEPGLPPLVAEDLGTITPAVEALRRTFAMPGTRVLQFAFDGDPANPHLPRNHETGCVVYTGTHDNDTLAGWWGALPSSDRDRIAALLDLARASCCVDGLVEALLDSPAALAVVPMQDLLALGSRARMNTPGHAGGNWRWCLHRGQADAELACRLRSMLARSGRLPEPSEDATGGSPPAPNPGGPGRPR